jgi:hypothetical protein
VKLFPQTDVRLLRFIVLGMVTACLWFAVTYLRLVLMRRAVLGDADGLDEQPEQEFPVDARIPLAHDVHRRYGLNDAEHKRLRVERGHTPGRGGAPGDRGCERPCQFRIAGGAVIGCGAPHAGLHAQRTVMVLSVRMFVGASSRARRIV